MKRIRVEAAAYFQKQYRRLSHRYRNIAKPVDELTTALENGDKPGDKIPNIGYDVYKVRLANPDAGKGKRGGFRVIYYVQLADRVILLTIYAKSEQENIPVAAIQQLIEMLPED